MELDINDYVEMGFPLEIVEKVFANEDCKNVEDTINCLMTYQLLTENLLPKVIFKTKESIEDNEKFSDIDRLVEMGFSRKEAKRALIKTFARGKSLEKHMHDAQEYLLSNLDESDEEVDETNVVLSGDLREDARILTKKQRMSVNLIFAASREESDKAIPSLKKKITNLGFDEDALMQTLIYIRDRAPIIIHLNLSICLKHLINDTHFRNLFEIGRGGGCNNQKTRAAHESRIFNTIYDDAEPFDRVKYGVLNVLNDPQGVKACCGYGQSYLILKKVRLRTTFASSDTFCKTVRLSCCEHYAHVLNSYSNEELRAVVEVATGKRTFNASNIIRVYKEIQIHGEIRLGEHVEALVVHHKWIGNKVMEEQINQFSTKHDVKIIWMTK